MRVFPKKIILTAWSISPSSPSSPSSSSMWIDWAITSAKRIYKASSWIGCAWLSSLVAALWKHWISWRRGSGLTLEPMVWYYQMSAYSFSPFSVEGTITPSSRITSILGPSSMIIPSLNTLCYNRGKDLRKGLWWAYPVQHLPLPTKVWRRREGRNWYHDV